MKPYATHLMIALASTALAAEIHVATTGADSGKGNAADPLRTIRRAAELAQPGDAITVHAGIYRERVNPPRGGTSESARIIYQAAPGENVTITGSEPAKGWKKVSGDAWKLTLPSSGFGNFNPYVDRIHGDWFAPQGRVHHTGCVYLNGAWMVEATSLDEVLKPAGATPLWYAKVDGDTGQAIVNLAWFKPGKGPQVSAGEPSYRYGTKPAPCAEGGVCAGFILSGHWMRFDNVEFGKDTASIDLRTAAMAGDSVIEIRRDHPEGELLGTAQSPATGDWQKWQTVTAAIKPVSGKQSLCLLFKSAGLDSGNTVIHAQFPGGTNPNEAKVEINQRQTVFYPSKNYINYITVRGFTLENAATNWAPPSSEQWGLVGTNWSKGWVIEDNTVRHSKCAGISLGKYGDGTDNTNDGGAADPYTACVKRAQANGWNKATVGSHVVRNNHIYHCEQVGIVGSLGCAFSKVTGNHIHDIYVRRLFAGAEMAGIKFHAAVDTLIAHNRIHRTPGIWLDWMTQGTRVHANLMYDNGNDIFLEVNHGPYLVDNNILLSNSIVHQSHGGAFVHNLLGGTMTVMGKDSRLTPYLEPHGTAFMGVKNTPDGDDRFFNNLFTGGNGLSPYDRVGPGSLLTGGNLYLNGSAPWKHESEPVRLRDKPDPKLEEVGDEVFLSLTMPKLPDSYRSGPVTADTLGKVLLSDLGFTHPDGSFLKIDADYFGRPRAASRPAPGPFEATGTDRIRIKVWPRATPH